jgi:hypothetical protein
LLSVCHRCRPAWFREGLCGLFGHSLGIVQSDQNRPGIANIDAVLQRLASMPIVPSSVQHLTGQPPPGIRLLRLTHSTAQLIDTIQMFASQQLDHQLAVAIESPACRVRRLLWNWPAWVANQNWLSATGIRWRRERSNAAEATFKDRSVHRIRGACCRTSRNSSNVDARMLRSLSTQS